VHTAHVVRDVLAQTERLDRVVGQIAGADEAAAEIEEDLRRPGALGVAGVPEVGK